MIWHTFVIKHKVDKSHNAMYIKTNGDAMQKEQLASVKLF